MPVRYLNLATAPFPENRQGGLIICGINWGGPEDSTPLSHDVYGESFFSDGRYVAGPSPYRRNIIRWFDLLGHPLAMTEADAGPFERSIVQTNWMSDQAPNMRSKDTFSQLVATWENFEFHVARLEPRVIMFMGVGLLEAMNSAALAPRAERLLGRSGSVRWEAPEVVYQGRARRSLSFGLQEFERANVVALPHASGTIGLTDGHIEALTPRVSPVIARYKADRGFRL
jgi:hypothetical protein